MSCRCNIATYVILRTSSTQWNISSVHRHDKAIVVCLRFDLLYAVVLMTWDLGLADSVIRQLFFSSLSSMDLYLIILDMQHSVGQGVAQLHSVNRTRLPLQQAVRRYTDYVQSIL